MSASKGEERERERKKHGRKRERVRKKEREREETKLKQDIKRNGERERGIYQVEVEAESSILTDRQTDRQTDLPGGS